MDDYIKKHFKQDRLFIELKNRPLQNKKDDECVDKAAVRIHFKSQSRT